MVCSCDNIAKESVHIKTVKNSFRGHRAKIFFFGMLSITFFAHSSMLHLVQILAPSPSKGLHYHLLKDFFFPHPLNKRDCIPFHVRFKSFCLGACRQLTLLYLHIILKENIWILWDITYQKPHCVRPLYRKNYIYITEAEPIAVEEALRLFPAGLSSLSSPRKNAEESAASLCIIVLVVSWNEQSLKLQDQICNFSVSHCLTRAKSTLVLTFLCGIRCWCCIEPPSSPLPLAREHLGRREHSSTEYRQRCEDRAITDALLNEKTKQNRNHINIK